MHITVLFFTTQKEIRSFFCPDDSGIQEEARNAMCAHVIVQTSPDVYMSVWECAFAFVSLSAVPDIMTD